MRDSLPVVSYAASPIRVQAGAKVELPFIAALVPAGFPSPAEDYLENALDLGAYLVSNPKTTFFMRCVGESMVGAGINDGDLLVIDRAVTARDKSIVVVRINEEFCVKRLRIIGGAYWLYPENPNFQPIQILEGDDVEVWGVVMHAITDLKGKPAEQRQVKNGRNRAR